MGAGLQDESVEVEGAGLWPDDALAALHRSLKRYLLNSELSLRRVGLRRQASTFDPCLFFVLRDDGQAVGALTTHIDDILGCGEPDVLAKIRNFPGARFGELTLQEESFCASVRNWCKIAPFRPP